MKSSPCCRQCRLPSNCFWQMVALRACQSLPQLKIHSEDNRSILKDTMHSQHLSLSVRNCVGPGLSGLLTPSDRVEGSVRAKGARGWTPRGCLEKCLEEQGEGGRKGERRNIRCGSKYLVVGCSPVNLAVFSNLLRKVRLERKTVQSQRPRARRDTTPLPSWESGDPESDEKSWLSVLVQAQGPGFPGVGPRPPAPDPSCMSLGGFATRRLASLAFAVTCHPLQASLVQVNPFVHAFSHSFIQQIFIKHPLPYCADAGDTAGDKYTRSPPLVVQPVRWALGREAQGAPRDRHWGQIQVEAALPALQR